MPAGVDIEVHTPASQSSQTMGCVNRDETFCQGSAARPAPHPSFHATGKQGNRLPCYVRWGTTLSADRFGTSLWALFDGFRYPAIDEQILLSDPSWVNNIA